ncbi:MAG: hypothetical protein HFI09_01855 [Bacilli bacterium]|nr:hypothetical protein [Bacilli bacterium]
MKIIDLKIVNIKYKDEEENEIIRLCDMLSPALKEIEEKLHPSNKMCITVQFGLSKINQEKLIEMGVEILKRILTKNLAPSYKHLIPKLAMFLIKNQFTNPIVLEKEYLCKEIINPYDDISLLSDDALSELQLAYILLRHQEKTLEFLTQPQNEMKSLLKDAYDYVKTHYKISRDKITTPESVLEYVWQNIKYGWKKPSGEVLHKVTYEWYEEYQIPSVEEVLENHYGCCVDMARVSAYLLKQINYQSLIRLTEFYGYFHAYSIYKDEKNWYRLDAESKNDPPIKKETYSKKELENHLSNCGISIFDLPENIDHKKICDVYESLQNTHQLRKNKKLANQD